MKYRIFAVLVLTVLVLNLGGSTLADSKGKKTGAGDLVSLLPASDGVVTLDVKRFFAEAMPRLLASNQSMLTDITTHLDKFQEQTGIDVRKFEYIAAGINVRKGNEKNADGDPVVIARGQISSASLIGAAKLVSNAKYTEEHFGERTIYIFSHLTGGSGTDNKVQVPSVVAVTAIDQWTIAFGTPARVRQTLEGKSRIGVDLTTLLERTPTAVVSFATKIPPGTKTLLPMENDELGKSIDSIQYIYGNADVGVDNASLHVTARTLLNAQAKSLHETLEGLQMIGKGILGGAKGVDKQVFARMIDNVKFSVRANEVMFDLVVPQSDIDIIVGSLKQK